MTPRNPPFEFRYLPTGQGWWAYRIVRRTDMTLMAGGECRNRRAAIAMAKIHAVQLLNERVAA